MTHSLWREGRRCQASEVLGQEQELVPSIPPSTAGHGWELSGPELVAGTAGRAALPPERGLCGCGQACPPGGDTPECHWAFCTPNFAPSLLNPSQSLFIFQPTQNNP